MTATSKDLFRKIREKAKYVVAPYYDSKLEMFLAMINNHASQTSTYYLGYGEFKETHFHYLLSLMGRDAVISLISLVSKRGERKDYTFFHLGLDFLGDLENFKGVYSTSISKKEAKFNHELGSIIMNSRDEGEFILQGTLSEALYAKIDERAN